jgi:hypothetical protein
MQDKLQLPTVFVAYAWSEHSQMGPLGAFFIEKFEDAAKGKFNVDWDRHPDGSGINTLSRIGRSQGYVILVSDELIEKCENDSSAHVKGEIKIISRNRESRKSTPVAAVYLDRTNNQKLGTLFEHLANLDPPATIHSSALCSTRSSSSTAPARVGAGDGLSFLTDARRVHRTGGQYLVERLPAPPPPPRPPPPPPLPPLQAPIHSGRYQTYFRAAGKMIRVTRHPCMPVRSAPRRSTGIVRSWTRPGHPQPRTVRPWSSVMRKAALP